MKVFVAPGRHRVSQNIALSTTLDNEIYLVIEPDCALAPLILLGLLFLLFQLLHVVVELVVDRIVPVHVVEAGHMRRVNKIKMHRGEAVKHDTGHETKEILHCNIKWEVNSIFAAVEKNIKHLSKGFSSWESSRTLLTPGYVSSSFLSMCEELIGSTSSFACKKGEFRFSIEMFLKLDVSKLNMDATCLSSWRLWLVASFLSAGRDLTATIVMSHFSYQEDKDKDKVKVKIKYKERQDVIGMPG